MNAAPQATRPAAALLEACGHPEARRLVVCETADEVSLSGKVTTFYAKQVAQESIREAMVGRRLVNKIEVLSRPPAN